MHEERRMVPAIHAMGISVSTLVVKNNSFGWYLPTILRVGTAAAFFESEPCRKDCPITLTSPAYTINKIYIE